MLHDTRYTERQEHTWLPKRLDSVQQERRPLGVCPGGSGSPLWLWNPGNHSATSVHHGPCHSRSRLPALSPGRHCSATEKSPRAGSHWLSFCHMPTHQPVTVSEGHAVHSALGKGREGPLPGGHAGRSKPRQEHRGPDTPPQGLLPGLLSTHIVARRLPVWALDRGEELCKDAELPSSLQRNDFIQPSVHVAATLMRAPGRRDETHRPPDGPSAHLASARELQGGGRGHGGSRGAGRGGDRGSQLRAHVC